MNEKYTKALLDFAKTAEKSDYFIVGSVALLSYTQPYGYDREIHDIDIIMAAKDITNTRNQLKQLGYTQTTFINPRMPFYTKLMKYAQDRYLRFSKDDVHIEILATPLNKKRELVFIDIYPGIKGGFPKDEFTNSTYSNVEFRTISKEMLYFIKKFAKNTFGVKVKYKEQQHFDDMSALKKLISDTALSTIGPQCRICIFGISFKIPGFLYR